jgi:hypothetical protein
MIDKLDLRAPSSGGLRPEISRYIRVFNHDEHSHRVKPNAYYSGRCDLRPLGYDAILFLNCKFQKSHNHKLEILDTSKKCYSDFVNLAESVFEGNPDSLGIMRIDLTADVFDVPMSWLRPRTRIKFKQFSDEHGKLEYGQFGRTQVETLRAGKGDSLFRIYDKIAELQMQYRRLCRKASKDAEPPNFEREFGYRPDAVVTRFERQCRGQSVPDVLDSFAKLPYAPKFNPFDIVEIMSSGKTSLPTIEECETPSEYFIGKGLNQECREMGMQRFRPWLNKKTGGNAARMLKRYHRFFPTEGGLSLTGAQLYEKYRESMERQLAG